MERSNLARRGESLATSLGTDQEVISAMRALYRSLVPEMTGAGSTQNANGYLSPLTDPDNRSSGAAAAKLARPRPNWLSLDQGDPSLFETANDWLLSDASAAWSGDTGSPPGWLRAAWARKPGNPDWWSALIRCRIVIARCSRLW